MRIKKEQIDLAWDYIKTYLLNKYTNLICDHKHTDNKAFPTVEEISKLYPNPCGYGTGMEDGMINGATMLDACLCRYEKFGESHVLELIERIAGGMLDCAESAKTEGFIPRSVSPHDRKSHYADSSRDQYTMFLFAMHRFLKSGFCSEADKERIKHICVGVAKRAEKNVIKENDYDILCDDGERTLVNIMWGDSLGNHEYLRLPMIYAMAWSISGETHWLELYKNIRREAYEKSLPMGEYWHLYTLQQMQSSIIVLMEIDTDEIWKERYLVLMNEVADCIEAQIKNVRAEILKHTNYNMPQKSFRDCKKRENHSFNRKREYISIVREDADEFFILQDAANIVIVASMVPGRKIKEEAVELFCEAFEKIDFSKHERCVPVHFMQGYFRVV